MPLHNEPLHDVDERTSTAPRTLIVSWHWPPTSRASAGVLGSLFRVAPPGVFRAVTPSFAGVETSDDRRPIEGLDECVPASRVRSSLHEQRQPGAGEVFALWNTARRLTRRAVQVGRTWRAQRVMAVYPHRWSLFVGMIAAERLGLPLVIYMHDLLAECVAFKQRMRNRFWRAIDRVALDRASLVIVPTEEFAEHYRRRGVTRVWVLPHCCNPSPVSLPPPHEDLRLLYSGKIYEPHADAARAFITATRGMPGVDVTYHTPPDACDGLLRTVGARWVGHHDAIRALAFADVCVVLLGFETPCPEEVRGCFPSKIVDYLAAGRPILSVVPEGSFVDRLVRENHCGLSVNESRPELIRAAVDRLRSADERSQMSAASVRLARKLRAESWMERLLDRLHSEPGARPRCKRSGSSHPIRDREGGVVSGRTTPLPDGRGSEKAVVGTLQSE